MLHISWPFEPGLAVFVAASMVLAVTPGPGVIYLVTRTISQGRRVGLASTGGVALGNFGNAVFAAVGLAMLFAVWARSFMIVKLAGAAYLVFLGLKALRPASTEERERRMVPGPQARAFRDGFLVALLNPKTAVFFAAFLPQFVDPHGSPLRQSLALGALFVAIAACTDSLYVLAADALAPGLAKLGGRTSHVRYFTALTLIALGILVACEGPRAANSFRRSSAAAPELIDAIAAIDENAVPRDAQREQRQ
ncbi:MAG: LysE family translocator [Steroidobacteraceae bacterium]